MKNLILFSVFIMTFIVISNTTSAEIEINLELNNKIANFGDEIILNGTVENDFNREFDYRIFFITIKSTQNSERVIICDSNQQKTSLNGEFSFTCNIPQREEFINLLGINSTYRSIIPIKAGIVLNDSVNGTNIKKSTRILVIDQNHLNNRVNKIFNYLSNKSKNDKIREECNFYRTLSDVNETVEEIIKKCNMLKNKTIDNNTIENHRTQITQIIENIRNSNNSNTSELIYSFVNLGGIVQDVSVEDRIKSEIEKTKKNIERSIINRIKDKISNRTSELRDRRQNNENETHETDETGVQ